MSGERMEPKVVRQLSAAMYPTLLNGRVNWGDALRAAQRVATAPATSRPIIDGNRLLQLGVFRLGGASLPDTVTVAVEADGPAGLVSWPVDVPLAWPEGAWCAVAVAGAVGAMGLHCCPRTGVTDLAAGGAVSRCTGRLLATFAARSRIRDLEVSEAGRAEAVALAEECVPPECVCVCSGVL